MNPTGLTIAAAGLVNLAALPKISGRRIAASVVLVLVISAITGPVPTLAWGLAGLLFTGAFLTAGVPLIRRILP